MTELRPDNEAIFHAARDIPDPDRRREYVREACGTDESRIVHIEALLVAAAAPDSLLDQPAPATDTALTGPWGSDADLPLDFLAPSETQGSLGRLGHYEVKEVVGRGGMGVVLKAFDERLHRVVAIKVMAPQLAASATARRRFTREARAAAAVTHDHVVTIHAVEDTGPLPYIVMQFVSGVSLQERLDRTGPLQLHEILRIGMQAALGLAAAHAQGLVHRDVKPANILLENGVERVKLTDFGLARAADDASLTQSGMIAGTPSFMSPEQAEGRPVDQRSDLFSLGSVLYAMCTGRPPFRAGTSMGVLKRVCDETPTPVREANPEVPGWLAELIAKLHAKDPAARFQSAAEVAEVLGRHLAHVQHPSQVSVPAAPGPAPAPLSRPRKHRWAVAAAVLVAVLATLGTTEATGVTKVRATVIRFFTPDGTLVVETDDPDVKVTVEGDGDLVITGAGPREVRLKAGSYRLRATKDGQPVKLDRDLVAITRGDTQIVRVRLEDEPPAAVVPKAEPGAFVVIGPKGVEMRKYDTLAEAVVGASDGDIIEVRGNGPFVTEQIKIGSALTIRAGDGFRPVISLAAAPMTQTEPNYHVGLETVAPLVLEGLEFRLLVPAQNKVNHSAVFAQAALRVANCRFLTNNASCLNFYLHPINVSRLQTWEVRNCEFLCSGEGSAAVLDFRGKLRLILDNCVATAACVVGGGGVPEPKEPSLLLTRNTFRCRVCAVQFNEYGLGQAFEDAKRKGDALLLKAAGNIFHCDQGLSIYSPPLKFQLPADSERRLAQVVAWKGERNLYSVTQFLNLWLPEKGHYDLAKPVKSLSSWREFWGTDEADTITGNVGYQGGNLLARVQSAPEKLTPEDFRLRADSAGYKAGKDGKDLGADVDLVGPGAAYERWKNTPEYQKWLKETGQQDAHEVERNPTSTDP